MINFPTIKENWDKYINARFPILYVYSFEESKVDGFIKNRAEKNRVLKNILEWNGANGLVRFQSKSRIRQEPLDTALTQLQEGKELDCQWLVIKDAADILNPERTVDPAQSSKVIALLKELSRKIRSGKIRATVIIVASSLHIPKALEKEIYILELDYPGEEEIKNIIKEFITNNRLPEVNPGLIDEMAEAFKGLTEFEVGDLLRLAISTYGEELTENTRQMIFEQKRQIVMKSGILEMVQLKEDIKDIGGLELLKEWLKNKARIFKDMKKAKEFGVATPKGVMIVGMPGCGKSLCAKAAGNLFNVPLLRLDMGRLMGKYVGESEENMRNAIRLAEAISPCVLWVDELEKAFAGIGSGGSEVTTRLFGTFLTWMQDKKSPVFVLATANKIEGLPPELMRKGRFDEIFYVDLPEKEERKKIFEIHIKKKNQDVSKIDLDAVADDTDKYSGADIECIVNESIEKVFLEEKEVLTTDDLLECRKKTHSISETMPETIGKLREFYKAIKIKPASYKKEKG